jgi:dienelactone hydrolase
MRKWLGCLLLVAVLLTCCAQFTPTPTPTPVPVQTAMPTAAAVQEMALAPFVAAELGIRGMAPADWDQAEPGHFMPPDPGDWDTRLIHEFFPGTTTSQLVESLLSPVLGLVEWPDSIGGHPSSRLSWALYEIEFTTGPAAGSVVDLAVAENGAGIYLVGLLAPKDQRETLRTTVFLPAVNALEPVPLEDSSQYYRDSLALFDYDAHVPLDIQDEVSTFRNGVTWTDFTYASPKGGRVPATLLVPDGPGPFAGIVLMHGMPSRRQDVVNTGERFARAGAVVIAIDAPHARPEHLQRADSAIVFTERDREEQIQLIVDLRRAVDLLLARPDVDPQRLAYVGFSYGGAMGGLLAGVEDRLQAYVLVVGDGGLVTHSTGLDDMDGGLYALAQDKREAWWGAMWPIEPIHFVGHAAPAALLFQSGRQDRLVPLPDAVRYQLAGSEPKDVMWYDAGHSLGTEAWRDQAYWLEQHISIDGQALAP